MKLIKLSFILAVALLAIVGISTTSYAFHSGGVAECEGCHTMHNSLELGAMTVDGVTGAANSKIYLLQGVDQSSTCLNCHNPATADTAPSSYHISTQMTAGVYSATTGTTGLPVEMTPGGDFAWLKVDFTWAARETASSGNVTGDGYAIETSEGQRHGHSIVAADYLYDADSVNTVAPGGTYPATSLTCISCHDPHSKYRRTGNTSATIVSTGAPIIGSGSYRNTNATAATASAALGVYRILGGTGYIPKSQSATAGVSAFGNIPPTAVAPSTYNQNEAAKGPVRVAYGDGMSAWCGNCHTDFAVLGAGYVSGASGHPHPAGVVVSSTVMNNYNSYVKSGDLTGNSTSAYQTLIPFEEGAGSTFSGLSSHASNSTLGTWYSGSGMTATAQVMCLSCHRAHATAFDSMAHWYNGGEFVTQNGSYVSLSTSGTSSSGWNIKAEGRSPDVQQQAYYGKPATDWAFTQRSLCNKCHAKD